MRPVEIAGLRDVVRRFDALLLDQFGVLHDGDRPFPGAVDAVERARAAGLRLAVLSNSGKSGRANAARLARLGFPEALFDAVITSGDACRARLAADLATGRIAEGARVLLTTRGGDRAPIEGLALVETEDAEDAALVVISGRDAETVDLEEDVARLAAAARRGAPCYCANPDLSMYAGGAVAPAAGALAARYAALGGPVTMIGKPAPDLFRAALGALGVIDPGRALMIGDSPAHDIAGARAVGCATLLVTEGVQAAGGEGGPPADHAMPRLVW